MLAIEELLEHEVKWRTDEIAVIKSLPYLHDFSNKQRETLHKHTIPVFYALWEGFVKDGFKIYASEITKLNLEPQYVSQNLLVHSIDMHNNLRDQRVTFEKKKNLVLAIQDQLSGRLNIPSDIRTNSNIDFKTLKLILQGFDLEPLPERPFKSDLDKLVFHRNALAHGEFAIPINQKKIDTMSEITISLMHQIMECIIYGYENRSYLQKNTNL